MCPGGQGRPRGLHLWQRGETHDVILNALAIKMTNCLSTNNL